MARIRLPTGKVLFLGAWATEREAAVVIDRVSLHLRLDRRLHFPRISRELGPLSPEEARALQRPARKRFGWTSQYVGVHRACDRWQVRIQKGGRRDSVTVAGTEKEAAIIRDRLVRGQPNRQLFLNFPKEDLTPLSVDDLRAEVRRRRRANQGGSYIGIAHWPGRRKPWGARIYANGKQIALGQWPTARAAAEAYDRAALCFGRARDELNFPYRARLLGPSDPASLRREAVREDEASGNRFAARKLRRR
jgi:hypothetical protein